MKKGYKIGLFFALFFIVLLIVLVIWKRYTWKEQLPDEMMEQNTELSSEQQSSFAGDVISSSQDNNLRTTCDTICIYEDIDQKDGSVVLTEDKLPGKYIDMTRSELERALYDDSRQLSLVDKEKGFQSQHLELFSGDKVKIVRIYDTTEEITGYYIMAAEDEVWIFKDDKETVYFKTDLILDELPEEVRMEVIEGKYMDSEEKIYHFLESYSS